MEIAIIDFNGNVTASVRNPHLVGKSSTHKVDTYGDSATRRAMMLAKTGGGFMALLVTNTEKEGYVDLRLAMVEPLTDEYYVYTVGYIGTFEDVLTLYLNKTAPTP